MSYEPKNYNFASIGMISQLLNKLFGKR